MWLLAKLKGLGLNNNLLQSLDLCVELIMSIIESVPAAYNINRVLHSSTRLPANSHYFCTHSNDPPFGACHRLTLYYCYKISVWSLIKRRFREGEGVDLKEGGRSAIHILFHLKSFKINLEMVILSPTKNIRKLRKPLCYPFSWRSIKS